jgi:hypothetical protein
MQFLLGVRFVCHRVGANPLADEKARSLERDVQRRDAQIVVVKFKNKQKISNPVFV